MKSIDCEFEVPHIFDVNKNNKQTNKNTHFYASELVQENLNGTKKKNPKQQQQHLNNNNNNNNKNNNNPFSKPIQCYV